MEVSHNISVAEYLFTVVHVGSSLSDSLPTFCRCGDRFARHSRTKPDVVQFDPDQDHVFELKVDEANETCCVWVWKLLF